MTTPSYKVLVRVLPVAGFLVVALAVALLSAPDTFRYRGWPKPVRSAPLQSLVGLAPQLDARDPIGVAPSRQVTIGAASGARGATASPGLTTGVTGHAALRSRTVGQPARQGSPATAQRGGQAQRVASGRPASGDHKRDRRGEALRAQPPTASKPAATASEAGYAKQVAPSYSAPRTPSVEHHYARRSSHAAFARGERAHGRGRGRGRD